MCVHAIVHFSSLPHGKLKHHVCIYLHTIIKGIQRIVTFLPPPYHFNLLLLFSSNPHSPEQFSNKDNTIDDRRKRKTMWAKNETNTTTNISFLSFGEIETHTKLLFVCGKVLVKWNKTFGYSCLWWSCYKEGSGKLKTRCLKSW